MGIPWDGTGINCYGMEQINMTHGQPCKFRQNVFVNHNLCPSYTYDYE